MPFKIIRGTPTVTIGNVTLKTASRNRKSWGGKSHRFDPARLYRSMEVGTGPKQKVVNQINQVDPGFTTVSVQLRQLSA